MEAVDVAQGECVFLVFVGRWIHINRKRRLRAGEVAQGKSVC